jgi:hypothetical protein
MRNDLLYPSSSKSPKCGDFEEASKEWQGLNIDTLLARNRQFGYEQIKKCQLMPRFFELEIGD